jgi:hypothetical protein
VPIGQRIVNVVWAIALTQCWGCAHGPRNFGKVQNPAPLVRARAVGLAGRQPDSRAVPALVNRLGDGDPVVRLAAHEELRRRTGRDFGYRPWETPEERSRAVDRWRAWLGQGSGRTENSTTALPPLPGKTLPVGP